MKSPHPLYEIWMDIIRRDGTRVRMPFTYSSKRQLSLEQRLYLDALRLWGTDSQIDICIEEFAECIQALAKFRRRRRGATRAQVAEEIADADICLSQMKLLFPEYAGFRRKKLARLRRIVLREKQVVQDWNFCPLCGGLVKWDLDRRTASCDACGWNTEGGLAKK